MGRPQVSNISDFVEQTLQSPLPSPEVLLLLQLDLLGVVVGVVVELWNWSGVPTGSEGGLFGAE